MYYIYHIPGVKIGVSKTPKQRVMRQGYSNYEILESSNCLKTVSAREKELQQQYGYKVDKVDYLHTGTLGKSFTGKDNPLYGKGNTYVELSTGIVGTASELSQKFNRPMQQIYNFAHTGKPIKRGPLKGLHFQPVTY